MGENFSSITDLGKFLGGLLYKNGKISKMYAKFLFVRNLMCGLCGLIEEQSDWTASLADLPRRQERYKRLALINRLISPHRLKVSDVHGVNYLIETPTGKQAIANGLGELWQQIERLTNKPLDVLDNDFLNKLEQQ